MKSYIAFLLVASSIIFAGCSADAGPANTASGEPPKPVPVTVSQVSSADAAERIAAGDVQFVDVRTPEEYSAGHAKGAINIPLGSLMDEYKKISKDKPVYLICESGRRSTEAGIFLQANGYTEVHSIIGGTPAWKADGRPMQDQ
ncbi:hypothetical protein BH24ACI3_BH24ACI3_17330 [soil metagenome]